MIFTRQRASPSKWTFSIPPIRDLLLRYIPQGENAGGPSHILDPFAGQSGWGTHRNDLANGMESREWLRLMSMLYPGGFFDVGLLDPPYSPRQISESYKGVGRAVSMTDTQNAVLYKECIDIMVPMLRGGAIAIRCGWNSLGFGERNGFEMLEILLVNHGAAHNDTIVTVERKR